MVTHAKEGARDGALGRLARCCELKPRVERAPHSEVAQRVQDAGGAPPLMAAHSRHVPPCDEPAVELLVSEALGGTRAKPLETFLMRGAIMGHQWSSEVIRGHHSGLSRCEHLMRGAIMGHQWSSEVIRGHHSGLSRCEHLLRGLSQELRRKRRRVLVRPPLLGLPQRPLG